MPPSVRSSRGVVRRRGTATAVTSRCIRSGATVQRRSSRSPRRVPRAATCVPASPTIPTVSTIARGMSMEQVTQQHADIDDINARYEGRFRLFKGIEANIGPDGSLDLEPQELRRFEFVVAAPHSMLRKADGPDARAWYAQCRRRACASWVTRRGAASTCGRVCRRTGTPCSTSRPAAAVAIEIDGTPHRQDVHYELAARALAAGCIFALDSDAHAHEELAYVDVAIAHARLARHSRGSDRQLLEREAVPGVGEDASMIDELSIDVFIGSSKHRCTDRVIDSLIVASVHRARHRASISRLLNR